MSDNKSSALSSQRASTPSAPAVEASATPKTSTSSIEGGAANSTTGDQANAAQGGEVRVALRRHTTGAVTFGDVGDVCTETDDVDVFLEKEQTQMFLRHMNVLLAGGIAGSVGKTVTAPLSRLTILFQVHSMVSTRHTDKFSSSVTGAFTKVLRNEGFLSFWKGNGASVLHRFPYSAVNFFTFELVKSTIIAQNNTAFQDHAWMTMFAAGASAGAVATIVCYPIDLIRTRLATQLNSDIRYRGIRHAAQRIRAEEGFFGLYRGLGATLMVTVPNLAINFTLYETLKDKAASFRRYQRQLAVEQGDSPVLEEDEAPLRAIDTLLCGGTAGIISSLATFPIDVVRRRLQISAIHSATSGIAPTPMGIATELFYDQGIRGFYRGLTPELMKVVPMVGITFGMFERLKALLDID